MIMSWKIVLIRHQFTTPKTRDKFNKKFSKPMFKTFLKDAKENQRERPTLFLKSMT